MGLGPGTIVWFLGRSNFCTLYDSLIEYDILTAMVEELAVSF